MNYWRNFRRHVHVLMFTLKSLSYNSSRPAGHFIDTAFEPLFWFVDHFTGYLGVIFVVAVTLLTSSVVILWYSFLRPVIDTYSSIYIMYHYLVGHYLLINIVFHYYQACFTHPGYPPRGKPIESIRGAIVCKHCIQPKPPRTHHCSICNTCYLKMDHHCPWMNNCIGFYNHRYFSSFCIFMWLGTVYVCFSSFDLFTYHFYHPGTLKDNRNSTGTFALSSSFGVSHIIVNLMEKVGLNKSFIIGRLEEYTENYRPHPGGFQEVHDWEHTGMIYLFVLCAAVTVALGFLNMWHLILICKGETSIEVHINNSEREKSAKRGMGYNNPYDYGCKENLKKHFGLYNGRTFLNVLFPSSHKPEGDGCSWPPNKKPVNYTDPSAYKIRQNFAFLMIRKFCPWISF